MIDRHNSVHNFLSFCVTSTHNFHSKLQKKYSSSIKEWMQRSENVSVILHIWHTNRTHFNLRCWCIYSCPCISWLSCLSKNQLYEIWKWRIKQYACKRSISCSIMRFLKSVVDMILETKYYVVKTNRLRTNFGPLLSIRHLFIRFLISQEKLWPWVERSIPYADVYQGISL